MGKLKIDIVTAGEDLEALDRLVRAARGSGVNVHSSFFAMGREGNQPVAYWEGSSRGRDIFASERIFVMPAYRGRGHGNALVRHQLETAREYGYRFFDVSVACDNIRSLSAQKKYGAKEIRRMGDLIHLRADLSKLKL